MKIYVDADACPVIDIIIDEANEIPVPVILVRSFSHFSRKYDDQNIETIYVDAGMDSADYRIMQLANKDDLIVTQDYGLASLGLGKGCHVIHHKGFSYTFKNIDGLLMSRHLNAKARKSGGRTKGPKALTENDRLQFRNLIHNILHTSN